MNTEQSRLIVTPGEPGGIGPDLCVALAALPFQGEWIVAADPNLIRQRAALIGEQISIESWTPDQSYSQHRVGTLKVWDVARCTNPSPGIADPANAQYVLDTLRLATQGCVNGSFDALVTGPVQKSSINEAGIPFTGHTEYLAALTGCDLPVMMLATEGLRVALATTHVPISQVSGLIKRPLVEKVIRLLHRDLQQRFGLDDARILVCGLNPHAGEDGHCGREDIDEIVPVIQKLKSEGMNIQGPLPADTLFTPRYLDQCDAVLAMYHDQGLPVLKYKGFGNAINITLGLPIIRTSVDHGTALSLAGTKGQVEVGSFALALKTARDMYWHQQQVAEDA